MDIHGVFETVDKVYTSLWLPGKFMVDYYTVYIHQNS